MVIENYSAASTSDGEGGKNKKNLFADSTDFVRSNGICITIWQLLTEFSFTKSHRHREEIYEFLSPITFFL